ncbi:hypothetical protein ANN_12538 [Periplaneta americana]|uniref:Uncharacterized protein n=1 Tax=Periplaneta americana TaxID=6978 RepID=A0ABQ8THV4_PERAM|nr:hypothetical protein ANN_12538 [Periplaneta americana]
MSPGSSTESYPAFARIGLRENPGKNLNQVTCLYRDSNPGHLVSQSDALTVIPQPVLTRLKTWLDAVNYYAEYYGKIMEVTDALDSIDSSAVAAVKSLPSEQLLEDILFIDSNFKIVSKSIILLESSKLQLSEALNIVDKVSQTVLQNDNSLISGKVKYLTETIMQRQWSSGKTKVNARKYLPQNADRSLTPWIYVRERLQILSENTDSKFLKFYKKMNSQLDKNYKRFPAEINTFRSCARNHSCEKYSCAENYLDISTSTDFSKSREVRSPSLPSDISEIMFMTENMNIYLYKKQYNIQIHKEVRSYEHYFLFYFIPVYGKAATITNALGGFSSTRICPLNSDIFPDHYRRAKGCNTEEQFNNKECKRTYDRVITNNCSSSGNVTNEAFTSCDTARDLSDSLWH